VAAGLGGGALPGERSVRHASFEGVQVLTILFGLASAVGWGAPDPVLATAVRRIGAFPVVFGSIVIGTVLASPLALVLDLPDWTERSLLLAPLVGTLTVVGFQAGFTSFRDGAVSVVAPIIACEGGVAALFSIAGGEHLNGLVLLGLPFAVAGVVLVSRGEGEGGRGGVVPAVAAALIWGGVLALSAPIAHDLGAGWAFLLVRGSAVVVMLPVALAVGAVRPVRSEWWRVAIWGICDAVAYFAFVLAADHGPAAVAGVLAAQFGTVGAVVAVVFFGEHLRRRQVVGIAIVAVAVGAMAVGGG
jgi:drug/metabolite transporter (DMT)-like permease